MLIALIDDGIFTGVCKDIRLEYDLIVEDDGTVRPRRADERILTNHGTTCAQIIHKYAPSASFCSLSIFHKPKLKTSIHKLLAALQWCKEHHVPIVHMSIGTTRPCDYRPIHNVIFSMLRQGQIIVAAHSNQKERYTVPACCTGVFGVATNPELKESAFYITDTADLWDVQIFASSRHDLSEYANGCKETIISNSYAAPTITAKIHEVVSSMNGATSSLYAMYQDLAGRRISITRMFPDFLTEALIFDPGNYIKQRDYASFNILGQYSNTIAFLDAIRQDRKTPIILLPSPYITTDFIDAICNYSIERLGVVYVGTVPEYLRMKLPCALWDESICQSFYKRMKPELIDPEIVIIRVEPQGEGALRLLGRLKMYLNENGCSCIAISDFPGAYLYGLEYLPEGCSLKEALSYLCYIQRPDIVLYSVQNDAETIHGSMMIKLDDCHAGTRSKDVAVLPATPTDEDIQKFLSILIEE